MALIPRAAWIALVALAAIVAAGVIAMRSGNERALELFMPRVY